LRVELYRWAVKSRGLRGAPDRASRRAPWTVEPENGLQLHLTTTTTGCHTSKVDDHNVGSPRHAWPVSGRNER
ncbi:MAG TPA: hypothetical protein VMX14_11575, partial [Anaerolineae bacterium]|nr:hypothetical protein [Anaerolineae bacterium]